MFESTLDFNSARVAADAITDNLNEIFKLNFEFEDLGEDVICSPMYGWLSTNDIDEIGEDADARFVLQYATNRFTALVIPSDNKVELLNEDGLSINPFDGSTFEADCPQYGAFKISDWEHFDLSKVA